MMNNFWCKCVGLPRFTHRFLNNLCDFDYKNNGVWQMVLLTGTERLLTTC